MSYLTRQLRLACFIGLICYLSFRWPQGSWGINVTLLISAGCYLLLIPTGLALFELQPRTAVASDLATTRLAES